MGLTDEKKSDIIHSLNSKVDRLGIDTRTEFIKETPITGICKDCGNSQIMKRKASNQVLVMCDMMSGNVSIPTDLEYCSIYYRKGQVSLSSMVEQAYIIDINEKPGVIGFKAEKVEDE